MLKPQVLRGRFVAREMFRRHRCPWMRTIGTSLKVPKWYPLEHTRKVVDPKPNSLEHYTYSSLLAQRQQRVMSRLRKPYPYPSDIARSISKAVDGMDYL